MLKYKIVKYKNVRTFGMHCNGDEEQLKYTARQVTKDVGDEIG